MSGKIYTMNVRDTDKAIQHGWHVVLIARSPGQLRRLIDDGRLIHEPDLAPSPKLLAKVNELKRNGAWNRAIFDEEFSWDFLQESLGKEFRDALNRLFVRVVRENQNVALTCFCKEDELCHRSIVMGLLQAIGVPYAGHKNFSPYWLERRILEVKSKKEDSL